MEEKCLQLRLTKVTIAILTFNEAANLQRLFRALALGEALPAKVLFIDNGSTDHTQIHIERARYEFPDLAIELLQAKENNLGRSRALAVDSARTEWIAFIDADTNPPRNWLKNLYQGYQRVHAHDPWVAAVGGMSPPPRHGERFYEALYLQCQTFFGHLNSSQAKLFYRDTYVSHIPTTNVLYLRKAVQEVGNFSSAFPRVCEDVDLSCRLRRRGYCMVMLPDAALEHYLGTSWSSWCERMLRFGRGQIAVGLQHPEHLGLRLFLPVLFLLYFIIALLLSLWSSDFLLLIFAYFSFVFFLSLVICAWNRKLSLFPSLFFLFVVTHFAYALGESIGLIWHWREILLAKGLAIYRKFFTSVSRENPI